MSEASAKIAELNDRFRRTFYIPNPAPCEVPGQVVFTQGIAALSPEMQVTIWAEVAKFDAFTEDNDPHGEHDLGVLEIEGVGDRIFWKIDYYADDSSIVCSENPADPAKSFRVLTIMRAEEY